eukprot:557175-Karenia_brevis.AAC.1
MSSEARAHWLRLRKLYFLAKTSVRKRNKSLPEKPPKDENGKEISSRRLKKAGRAALRAARLKLSIREQADSRGAEEQAKAISNNIDADNLTRQAWSRHRYETESFRAEHFPKNRA